MSTTATEGLFSIDFTAELPVAKRGGGGGKEGTKWEEILDPCRQRPGKEGLIYKFTTKTTDGKLVAAKNQAQARATVIGTRLREKVPMEVWKFNVRDLPTDPETNMPVAGLWVTYSRTMTEDEYEEYKVNREERANKIRAGRAKNQATDNHGEDVTPQPTITETTNYPPVEATATVTTSAASAVSENGETRAGPGLSTAAARVRAARQAAHVQTN